MEKINYEVVFVLVNRGYSETVMEAATKVGARGGTIISCRGNAYDVAEKSYGFIITPDKQLILIVVDSKIKETVMNAIYKAAGIETKAMGLIFSCPVSNVIGIKAADAKVEAKEEPKKVEKASKK